MIQGQFDKLKECYKELDDKCRHQEAQNRFHEQKVKKQTVPKQTTQEGTVEDFQKQSKVQDRLDTLREQNRCLLERQQDCEKVKKKLQERNKELEHLLSQYNADCNLSQSVVSDIQKSTRRQN